MRRSRRPLDTLPPRPADFPVEDPLAPLDADPPPVPGRRQANPNFRPRPEAPTDGPPELPPELPPDLSREAHPNLPSLPLPAPEEAPTFRPRPPSSPEGPEPELPVCRPPAADPLLPPSARGSRERTPANRPRPTPPPAEPVRVPLRRPGHRPPPRPPVRGPAPRRAPPLPLPPRRRAASSRSNRPPRPRRRHARAAVNSRNSAAPLAMAHHSRPSNANAVSSSSATTRPTTVTTWGFVYQADAFGRRGAAGLVAAGCTGGESAGVSAAYCGWCCVVTAFSFITLGCRGSSQGKRSSQGGQRASQRSARARPRG